MVLDRIVIVGASAAGLSAAQTLRDEGFKGSITLVGDEVHAGYDRPPLSKQMLLGTMERHDLHLRAPGFCEKHSIDLRSGVRATGLNLAARQVLLEGGEPLDYDGLIIATGLHPRMLPGPPPPEGVHVLRTLDDAESLRRDLGAARQVLVVGAGFLGSEIAATARQLGRDVVLLDPLPLPMLRQVGPEVAEAVMALHRRRGVDVRCGVGLDRFTGNSDGRVSGAVLGDGSEIAAQAVVLAIGSVPATAWLQGSGLALDDGVMCDEFCCAAEGVYAAGDVANWLHPGLGTRMRLEHRMNATEQGMAAAQNLLGAGVPFAPLPYFWTDLYDVKIQGFGRIGQGQELHVLSGDLHGASFTAAYVRDKTIEAVLGWNAPRELRKARMLVGQPLTQLSTQASPEPDLSAATATPAAVA